MENGKVGPRLVFMGMIILALSLVAILQFWSLGMKEVTSRGGQVRFKVPKSWVGEPEGTGIMYYAPTEDSGTLRLSVLTYKTRNRDPKDEPGIALIAEKRGAKVDKLPNGNHFLRFVDRGVRNGESLATTHWQLERAEPGLVVIAIFSYTHLDRPEDRARFQSEVEMLDREIRKAAVTP